MKALSRWGIPIVLFVFAFAVRWYALPDYLFFGFEQGRDAIVAKDISTFTHIPFAGPKTDLDGVFHGPWYYYIISIPYFLSGGNPLAASLFLVLLGSFVPVILYVFAARLTTSTTWGCIAGIFGVVSYELILFSRWLSNVSPAMVFVTLAFFSLWMYRGKKNQVWFIAAAVCAALAIQFEIILIGMAAFACTVLLVKKHIPRVKRQAVFLSAAAAAAVFLPLTLFTLKNRAVTINSVSGYLSGTGEKVRVFHPVQSLLTYAVQNMILLKRTIVYTHNTYFVLAFLAVTLLGLTAAFKKEKRMRKNIGFLMLWLFMTLPLLSLTDVAGLSQAYVGVAPSIILLTVLSFRALWKHTVLRVTLILPVVLIFLSVYNTAYALRTNTDVFFRTIQDDINYADQISVLRWVHESAEGQPYRLQAFTIPYFQPEAWQYLHRYHYPDDISEGAATVYVVIEEKVDPFWEHMWIGDLGDTKLLEELLVGKFRVQRRELL